MKTNSVLTVSEADKLVLAALTPEHGAVEDCEPHKRTIDYFLSSGHRVTVNRRTGKVTITPPPPAR